MNQNPLESFPLRPAMLTDADVHSHHRGQGTGSTLCRWAEACARRSMPRAPAGERVVLLRWMHLLDHDPDNDPSPFWYVAGDGEEIAGTCLCNPRGAGDPETAWIHIVGVQPPWRRRGLALAPLHHSFGSFYRQGRRRIAPEVDAQNPTGATHLYEKAGMHVERRYDYFEKELLG